MKELLYFFKIAMEGPSFGEEDGGDGGAGGGDSSDDMVEVKIGNETVKVPKESLDSEDSTDSDDESGQSGNNAEGQSKYTEGFNENIAFAKMLIDAGYPPEKIPFMLIVKNSTIRDKKEWVAALEGSQRMMSNKIANKEANEDMLSMIEAAISINQKGE